MNHSCILVLRYLIVSITLFLSINILLPLDINDNVLNYNVLVQIMVFLWYLRLCNVFYKYTVNFIVDTSTADLLILRI